ncbi:methyltransferase family protein [Krasilnikovia cinnamomea]|uniref:Arsenite methyltransferase n=1 Tax=Krasilnikovia cinnamomea TaxID=349313 RepID=A0A4Q7ZQD7_9ACTN|nr:arsenite methyltransferase [Krasilnikovia cinnamomea]RZU53317.1 methyltransferase family protein [Krasilnikovia cinnamomea]
MAEQHDTAADVREQVRSRYAAAALAVADNGGGCCGTPPTALDALAADQRGADTCCTSASTTGDPFGAGLYSDADRGDLPGDAVAASLGCGNPTAVADLNLGETVLDLGSGGGIDVLLSARRVGPTGAAYGLDMTDEMLELARRNAAQAGVTNVEFLKGQIEAIPLPDATVDVVISNCVINLSTDKPAVFAETFRVLKPGGRIGVSDVVAQDHLTPQQRAERGGWVGCVAGALSISEYRDGLQAAGFTDITITAIHDVADGMHSAIIKATKPTT